MPEGLPDINLLPKIERDRSSKNLLILTVIALIFISYIFIGFYYFYTKKQLEAVNEEHSTLHEEVHLKTEELEQLQSGSSSLAQAITFVEQYEIPTSSFITELDYLLPEHSYLNGYEYNNRSTNITVSFETLDKVAEYTTKLTNSDYIIDTKVDHVETFNLGSGEDVDIENNQFDVIPRYQTNFSLIVDKNQLKGESTEDDE